MKFHLALDITSQDIIKPYLMFTRAYFFVIIEDGGFATEKGGKEKNETRELFMLLYLSGVNI